MGRVEAADFPIPDISRAIAHDVSLPLRNIVPPVRFNPQCEVVAGLLSSCDGISDPSQFAVSHQYTTSSSYPFNPPDTSGAAGTTQYVQWVNYAFEVFDKRTHRSIFGPVAGNTIWQGFAGEGANCANVNASDTIVQYDKSADRWVMLQRAQTQTFAFTPYICFAVSTTSDATGSYNRYVFRAPYNVDYPKLGVWADGYYISFIDLNDYVWAACALDRSSMLDGIPAPMMQCLNIGVDIMPPAGLHFPDCSLLPADLDGWLPPPVDSPNYFVSLESNAGGSLNLWKFHADFITPANSKFSGPFNLPVDGFSPPCGVTAWSSPCISQRGTDQKLYAMGDVLMYRMAYRNLLNDHESLIVNHSVNAGMGNMGVTGVRWYEFRVSEVNPSPSCNGGYPCVYQQGTYAPDSNSRWMGGIAMDRAGDIALGYSVSSSNMYPAIRYTGRIPTDPLDTMEGETTIKQGAASQTNNVRWGDYSSMSIDPVDDCTFWYTNEYLDEPGPHNWKTRIASFKFPNCRPPIFNVFNCDTPPYCFIPQPVPIGDPYKVILGDDIFMFNSLTASGTLTVTAPSVSLPPLNDYRIIAGYDISYTGSFSGLVTIDLPYDPNSLGGDDPNNLRLLHYDAIGEWSDITSDIDTVNNRISGIATSLSPFAIVMPLFTFTPQAGVPLNTLITSNSITVSGIDAPASISITGGEYSINSGAFTSASGTVNDGDTVRVRQISSSSYSMTTSATLTIGGVSGTFSVTTIAAQTATASFTATSSLSVSRQISFDGSASTCGGETTCDSFTWNFGDNGGGSTTGAGTATPMHTYDVAGLYNVTLTVTNSGWLNSSSVTHQVSAVVIDTAPTISLGTCSVDSCTGLATMSYTVTDGIDLNNLVVTWGTNPPSSISWPGANDTFATGNVTHTYAANGTFNVTGTVYDGIGQSAVATTTCARVAPSNYSIAVTAKNHSGSQNAASAKVVLRYSNGTTRTGYTGSNGQYTFGNVPDCTSYTITVTKAGWTFTIPAASGTISGANASHLINAITP